MNNIPVTIREIRSNTNGSVSVILEKVIPNPEKDDKFSIAAKSGIELKDKKLVSIQTFKDASIVTAAGWKAGDVLTVENTGKYCDLVEYETTKLHLNAGLDKLDNVTQEPLVNPQTGEWLATPNGEVIFRLVVLLRGATPDQLASQVADRTTGKLPRGKAITNEFTGVKTTLVDGKNKKTPEYQEYLNALYTSCNAGVLTSVEEGVVASS